MLHLVLFNSRIDENKIDVLWKHFCNCCAVLISRYICRLSNFKSVFRNKRFSVCTMLIVLSSFSFHIEGLYGLYHFRTHVVFECQKMLLSMFDAKKNRNDLTQWGRTIQTEWLTHLFSRYFFFIPFLIHHCHRHCLTHILGFLFVLLPFLIWWGNEAYIFMSQRFE